MSPELQQERIGSFCRAKGWEVMMLEPELDVSGGKSERPILDSAIDAVAAGRYEGIVVAQNDRLSRMGLLDTLRLIGRIEAAGGQFVSVAENIDSSTPEGIFGRDVLFGVGNLELNRYKAQFARAKENAVRRGIWPFPKAPLGYTVQARKHGGDGRLYPDSPGKIVKAFRARAAGAPWSEVAAILETTITNATKVIRNRAYLGEINLGEWSNTSAHEALVMRDVWEAAQLEHARPPRGKNGIALLAGIVRCAGCRGKMSPSANDHGGLFYTCQKRPKAGGFCKARASISRASLDPYVEAAVLDNLVSYVAQGSRPTDALKTAQSLLAAAESALDVFQEATNLAGIDVKLVAKGLKERAQAVEAARRELAEARVLTEVPILGENPRELWEGLRPDERQHVLRGFLDVVWVRKSGSEVANRVRIVAAGHEAPIPLKGESVRALKWPKADLPGEIRPTAA